MRYMDLKKLGANGPLVPAVCVGTSPLGGSPGLYGYDVDEPRAIATVSRALELGFVFIDTSNEYGNGASERRIGSALRHTVTGASDVVIASKADPPPGEKRLDGPRVHDSFIESIERLGVDRLDVFYLHDPERFEFTEMSQAGGALDAMLELKADGLVDLVGVAGGDIDEMRRYLHTGLLDVLLHHNGFTLLDQSADQLIVDCAATGVAFVNAAPYASGILAKSPAERPRYRYRAPAAAVSEKVAWLHEVSGQFGVPLAALALQFSTRDERIASTVVGVSAPQRIDELSYNIALEIPGELWALVQDRLERVSPDG
jgi:D-threo-aldose 1-dehydrogenase